MKIVFVATCSFPTGMALSSRDLNLCRLLNENGHSVHVIADFNGSAKGLNVPCDYEYLYEERKNGIGAWKEISKKAIKMLTHYLESNKVDALIMNARYERCGKIILICKKRKIKVFVENCEWYHSSSFKLGKFDPRFWMNQKMILWDLKRADGMISISRLLNDHNLELTGNSVRIPTIMDVRNTSWRSCKKNNKINLVYTGSIGKGKELLAPIIRALSIRDEFRDKFVFNIYGPSKELVKKTLGKDVNLLCSLDKVIIIHGRVPQSQILNILLNADFQIFMRPNRRSSNAGFPTKLAESMSVGTPVISNNTGDIALYLENNKNGFLVGDKLEENLVEVFQEIMNCSDDEYMKMRFNARNTAETYFDYRKYKNEIEQLLSLGK